MSSLVKIGFVMLGVVIVASIGIGNLLSRAHAIEGKGQVKLNNQYIVVDIARDEDSRARGLSGRESLGVNEGMFFIFETPGRYGFWMKDMNFPIDIVWIKDFRVVGVTENISPQSGVPESDLAVYLPPQEVDRVLEIPAGRAKLLNPATGDRVLIRPLVPSSY